MNISDIYQVIMFIGAVLGCLGMGVLLGAFLGLPFGLVGPVAVIFGAIYGWILAEIVTHFPRLHERRYVPWGGVGAGCEKVLGVYLPISIFAFIMVPVFQQAREKAWAAGRVPPTVALPAWAAPVAVALPVGLAGIVALVGRRLRASRLLYHTAMEGDPEGARRLLGRGARTRMR